MSGDLLDARVDPTGLILRRRRAPGSNYLFRKYAGSLLGRRPCRITVPGPFSLVWVFACATFALQLVIALSCEPGEDSLPNILLTFQVSQDRAV